MLYSDRILTPKPYKELQDPTHLAGIWGPMLTWVSLQVCAGALACHTLPASFGFGVLGLWGLGFEGLGLSFFSSLGFEGLGL